MSRPVTLHFRVTVKRANGPDVSRDNLIAEIKYALGEYLLPLDSEYTVVSVEAWDPSAATVAAGQAAHLLANLPGEVQSER